MKKPSWTASQIEQRSIEKVLPYARNARMHSDAQVAQIAASIAEFGFVNPVLVGPDDVIVAGHGRVLAARKLGLDTVPVVVLGHLTETQRRALVIADNKIAENATWDEDVLRLELKDIKDLFPAESFGFEQDALQASIDGIDFDLGDGNIQSKAEMRQFMVFLPASSAQNYKPRIVAIVDEAGGAVVDKQ